MPEDYPWKRQDEVPEDSGWVECNSEIEFQTLCDSFDLTKYWDELNKEQMLRQQEEQRLFGKKLAEKIIDLIGGRNLYLKSKGVDVNVSTMASDNASLRMMAESGILKTILVFVGSIKSKYPDHSDIYDLACEDITNFLKERGWL
jgi:hypothetical protein